MHDTKYAITSIFRHKRLQIGGHKKSGCYLDLPVRNRRNTVVVPAVTLMICTLNTIQHITYMVEFARGKKSVTSTPNFKRAYDYDCDTEKIVLIHDHQETQVFNEAVVFVLFITWFLIY